MFLGPSRYHSGQIGRLRGTAAGSVGAGSCEFALVAAPWLRVSIPETCSDYHGVSCSHELAGIPLMANLARMLRS